MDVPTFNMKGEQTGSMAIDPAVLGSRVRPQLLKQAVVMYQANTRQGTVATRSRGLVAGSTRKIYRQKGTGNARMGTIRTVVRRGGGVAFAKGHANYALGLPKKMRRLARNNAILAKASAGQALVIEDLKFAQPATREFVAMLSAVGIDKGCVVALADRDDGIYLSGRNVPQVEICELRQLNAYTILRRDRLVFTRPAFQTLVEDPVFLRPGSGEDTDV